MSPVITEARPLRLALVGAPNCGKTSLFNALTGGSAKVANYPGVTVEYRLAEFTTLEGQTVTLMDLPGVYGDCGHSLDEKVTINAIRGEIDGEAPPDGLIIMMDAAHINTHLHNVLQIKNYGLPVILVLNMMDMAARDGIDIHIEGLEAALGITVIPSVAVRASGRGRLNESLDGWVNDIRAGRAKAPVPKAESLKVMQARARAITAEHVRREQAADTLTQKVDAVVLHPLGGVLILLAILFFMFQAVYTWSGPGIEAIEGGFGLLKSGLEEVIPNGWLRSLLVDGIIEGVGAVLVFLPQILILFAFILLLEASGYMTRAAFLVDTLMAKAGLNGRAFIPLLSSFACAIPGIMAARTIEEERDRLTTILIAPLMTCSARWPVYFLVIGAFIPATKVGGFNLQGLVAFGLVIVGVIFALIVAAVLKRTLLKGAKPTLMLELPSYKMPVFKDYLRGLWERAMIFINRAGRIILPATIIIWFLTKYPSREDGIESTFAGMIGRVLEPIFAPIGFTLEMTISLIPAMAAREVAVSALGTIYALDESIGEAELGGVLSADWSLATALAFLAWFIFAPQCLEMASLCLCLFVCISVCRCGTNLSYREGLWSISLYRS